MKAFMSVQPWRINELSACWRMTSWKCSVQSLVVRSRVKGSEAFQCKCSPLSSGHEMPCQDFAAVVLSFLLILCSSVDLRNLLSNLNPTDLGNPGLCRFEVPYHMWVVRGPSLVPCVAGLEGKINSEINRHKSKKWDQNRWEPSALGGAVGCEYSAEVSFLLFLYVIFTDLYYIQGNINTMQANFLI